MTRQFILSGMLSAAALIGADIVIKTRPPEPVSVAVVGRAPSARHVWVPGYYKGVGGRYVWVPGKWIIPPKPGQVWIPPRWMQVPSGYRFVPGHWR